ncbi:MAG: hypothetical protein HOP16_17970 [Acidobacteria bacterium]|nr:hypothetical protein [Acidobacteriota bacterium]
MRVSALVLVSFVLGVEPVSAQTHGQASPQTHDEAPVKAPAFTTPAVPQPAKTSVATISSSQGQPSASTPKQTTPDARVPQAANGNATAASTPAPRETEATKPTIKRLTPDEIEARLQALRDKVALARANAPKPRPRAAAAPKPIPRPRFVVHWPEERVTLSWPPPEEHFSVSWPR